MVVPDRRQSANAIEVLPLGSGYMVRLGGVWPVFARLTPETDGWSVALVAIRFDSRPQPVGSGLPSTETAVEVAATALAVVKCMEERDAYRFRFDDSTTNRWYVDLTARAAEPWPGMLPDLTWADGDFGHDEARAVLGYLDARFPSLFNLAQHRPHFDQRRGRTTDPNEHAVEVLAFLDTTGMTERERLLTRVAVVYHDVGKGVDSFDPKHPTQSALLAAPFLEQHGLTAEEAETALVQIREHDLLGMLSRGRLTVDEAVSRLRLDASPRNAELHFRITTADISAIRGLRWVVDQGHIRQAYERLLFETGAGRGTLGSLTSGGR